MINKIVSFFVCLIVGARLQEATMNDLYPNRPKGLIRNWFYNRKLKSRLEQK